MTLDLRRTSCLVLVCGLGCGQPGAGDSLTAATTANSTSTTDASTAAPTGTTTAEATTTAEPTTGELDPCVASPQALADCSDPVAYAEDLKFIADIRTPGTPHWKAVQDLCAERLSELGYQVQLMDYGSGVNVVGRRLGTVNPEQIVLVAAHYDHISNCRGADDNASGVAATLEIARLLAKVEFDRTVHIACWDEEEDGLIGSEAYVAAAKTAGDEIVVDFNFDMIGYTSTAENSQTVPTGFGLVFAEAYAELEANQFRGDFIAIISSAKANAHATAYAAAADRIGLRRALIELPAGQESSDLFADLRRSDHAPFWDAGYPAVFLTDTSEFRYANYHCMAGEDEVANLDLEFAAAVTRATVEASAVALGM
ncbi:M20/M25/M40 family metallo-hydrolase [Nannocystis bainbridge]|uniref:M20/M25/M40 family metallo-hydrolase n=1 Tax=Nannocystis bainbridge TaxID=2995303 RepID=A0ABT5DZG7_9BACT|nr:M20/M25/M40 family metallo-hydrolase [Nannocystis bainbridge]MDC0719024.1 M20/M25/M40 family metallo-hydrolase [Nannocystis bainbridge]